MFKRKLLSAVLVLTFAVLSLPAAGLSATAAGRQGFLTYERVGREIRITRCNTAADGVVTVPDEIDGLPVTAIAERAFMNCARLTGVVLPNSVTCIGGYAFFGCVSLKRLLIPESVTCIGAYAYGFQKGRNGRPVVMTDVLLYGYADTAAQRYAADYGVPYCAVSVLETASSSELTVDRNGKIVFTETVKLTADGLLASFTKSNFSAAVRKNGATLSGGDFTGTGCEIYFADGALTVDTLTLAVAGDLNGDSVVDALDAFLCDKAANGHTKLSGAYLAAADLDKTRSGAVDIADFSAVLNRAAGRS